MMKEKMIITLKKIVVTMVMAAMLISNGLLSINAQAVAAESQDWYLYYNDSHTNYPTCVCNFARYTEMNYTAEHFSRSASNVYTLIQPGTGTSFARPSYLVSGSKISFYVNAATSNYVYVIAKISYNTAPAHAMGTITRPEI